MDKVAKDKVEEILVRHGLTDVPLTDVNKDKAINDLLVAEVLVTRTLALNTFSKGLNCLGLGDLVHKHPAISCFVFPLPADIVVDVDLLKVKLQLAKGKTKEGDEAEAVAWQWFLNYVDEITSCPGKNLGLAISLCKNDPHRGVSSHFVTLAFMADHVQYPYYISPLVPLPMHKQLQSIHCFFFQFACLFSRLLTLYVQGNDTSKL